LFLENIHGIHQDLSVMFRLGEILFYLCMFELLTRLQLVEGGFHERVGCEGYAKDPYDRKGEKSAD